MQQILKRLTLIKTALEIEEEEIVELQIMKLNKLDLDNEVQNIIIKLEEIDYGSALVDIENYLSKFSGVVIYEDREIEALRLELKILEKKLQNLSEIKTDYLNDIDEFNTLYSLKLGPLISKILHLKRELLQKALKEKQEAFDKAKAEYQSLKEETKDIKSKKQKLEEELEELDEFDDEYDELFEEFETVREELKDKEQALNEKRKKAKYAKEDIEDDPVYEQYEEAKTDYEEFSNEYNEVKEEEKNRFEIDDEDKKELKKLFRKASKLCHPDIVTDELKEQATEMMKRLNEAYSQKDLVSVKKILHRLETGTGFEVASDSINDKEILKAKIKEFRENIADIENDIEEIKADDVFGIVSEVNDMDAYLERLEVQLQEEYETLQNSSVQSKKKTTEPTIDNEVTEEVDDYWDKTF